LNRPDDADIGGKNALDYRAGTFDIGAAGCGA